MKDNENKVIESEVMFYLSKQQLQEFAEFVRQRTIKDIKSENEKFVKKISKMTDPAQNTKKELAKYRNYVRNLEDEEEVEITREMEAQYRFDFMADLMGSVRDEITRAEEKVRKEVERKAEQAFRVREIERAVRLYMEETDTSGSEEAKRRFRVICAKYIQSPELKVDEIAELENVSKNTVYNDIEIACKSIAVYMTTR